MSEYYSSLSYENLFKESRPEIKTLVKDISLSSAIEFYSIICAQICMQPTRMDQEDVFKLIFSHLNNNRVSKLKPLIEERIKGRERECLVFSIINVNYSLNYCINNLKELSFKKLTKEQKYKLILVLFVATSIADEINEEIFHSKSKNYLKTNPKISSWPFSLYQTKLHAFVDPISSIIKLYSFLNYFHENLEYRKYVINFLELHNSKTIQEYASTFMNLISASMKMDIVPSALKIPEKFESFFENLSYDFKKTNNKSPLNFNNIIRTPILKRRNQEYIVLNWNFLNGKIYNTLVFDFYSKSGIKENRKFKKQTDILKMKGEEISENIILKNFLKDILCEKYSIVKFDDNLKPELAQPDCYYRKSNKIFIFELKDSLLSEKTMAQGDIHLIKNEIDKKFNSKSKGTGQIIKQLTAILNNKIESSSSIIKTKNIEIYPTIIYTDKCFNLSGIEEYLNNEFLKLLEETNLKTKFKFIYQISFIHLDIFILYNKYFKEKGFSKIFPRIVKKVRDKRENPSIKDQKSLLTDHSFEKVFKSNVKINSSTRIIDLNVLKNIAPNLIR
jgi:hypothetical protein